MALDSWRTVSGEFYIYNDNSIFWTSVEKCWEWNESEWKGFAEKTIMKYSNTYNKDKVTIN